MTVDPARAAGSYEYDGQTYYFCNPGCLRRFQADPEEFLKPRETELPVAPRPGVSYTCPMHPEIVRDYPGACPICGMGRSSWSSYQLSAVSGELSAVYGITCDIGARRGR